MEARGPAASTVEEYLAKLPPTQRDALERLRRQILAAAPMATEKISYRIPTFVHHGNLVHMAAFKDHCSFFPGSSGVLVALKSDIKGLVVAKGTIRFTADKPLPAALVKKIVKLRVAENAARAAARPAKTPKKRAASAPRAGTRKKGVAKRARAAR